MYNNPEQAKLASLIISIVILIIIVVLIVVVCCNWNTISANANANANNANAPLVQNPQKAALGAYAYNKNNFVDYASGVNPPWPCTTGFTYGSRPPRYYLCNTYNIQTATGGYCPGNYKNVNGLCIPSWAAPAIYCASNRSVIGRVLNPSSTTSGQLCASSYFLFNSPISSITQLGIQCIDYTDTNANSKVFYHERKGIFGTIVNNIAAIEGDYFN